MAAATDLPLSVDSERLFADDPAGVAETVRLLAAAGAAGCSIEDYDPATGAIDPSSRRPSGSRPPPRPPTRATRWCSRRGPRTTCTASTTSTTPSPGWSPTGSGRGLLYAPGLADPGRHPRRWSTAVGAPVNVLALPGAPSVAELAGLGVRRVSTGSLLASAAYGAMLAGARELRHAGTSEYGRAGLPRDVARGGVRRLKLNPERAPARLTGR